MPAPNILILMPDQLRADCLGCAGHPLVRTPGIDRLAREGVRLTDACTSSPVCMPARASFITGRHVHEHGMWHNEGELAAGAPSFFRRLQGAGYTTAHIGKSHYYAHGDLDMRDREPWMRALGFDYVHEVTGPLATVRTRSAMSERLEQKGLLGVFKRDYARRAQAGSPHAVWPSPLPTEEFPDTYVGREAVRYIEGYDGEEPFCTFVGFPGPHPPWDAPGDYATMYDPAETPPAICPEATEPGPWVPDDAARWQRKGRHADMTAGEVARLRANYYGKVSLVDHWCGRILEACERRGWLDDTLVVFWSDHGEMLGDHMRLSKGRFYESAVRVPLMLRWPGHVPPATTCDALAETVDIGATMLDAAGLPPDPHSPGVSLLRALTGAARPLRDAALSEIRGGGHLNAMVRTRSHKYAAHEDGTPYMLFDLEEDPDEARNLLGRPEAAELQARMHAVWLRRTGRASSPGA